VLDPSTFASVGCPEPGGVTPAALTAAVRALTDRFPLAGLGITEYEPSPDRDSDRDTLRTLVTALFTPATPR
jgi:arginase